jgi:hypothetical protein
MPRPHGGRPGRSSIELSRHRDFVNALNSVMNAATMVYSGCVFTASFALSGK